MSLQEIHRNARGNWAYIVQSFKRELKSKHLAVEATLDDRLKTVRRSIRQPNNPELGMILKSELRATLKRTNDELERLEASVDLRVAMFRARLAYKVSEYVLKDKSDFVGRPLLAQVTAIGEEAKAERNTELNRQDAYQTAMLYEAYNRVYEPEREEMIALLGTFFSERVTTAVSLLHLPKHNWGPGQLLSNLFPSKIAMYIKVLELRHKIGKIHWHKKTARDIEKRKGLEDVFLKALASLNSEPKDPIPKIEYEEGKWQLQNTADASNL